ncbi:hypothetical protein PMIN01_12148 [Paraphaeosphaeria minitans]|uniref:Uncharacterized protein n=1 Tax=Paraphaeosphaeria minitans TaxID=565426 RepID=A0A9P6G861_9PLEO|nr:hypothetical protein PMIN01_12148 [Paraphaeosphaeria minitans]
MSTSNEQPQPPQQGGVAIDGHPQPLSSNPVNTDGGTTSSTANTASESSNQSTYFSDFIPPASEEFQRRWEAAAGRSRVAHGERSQAEDRQEGVATNGRPHPLGSNPVTTGGETTSSAVNTASESNDQPTRFDFLPNAERTNEENQRLQRLWVGDVIRGQVAHGSILPRLHHRRPIPIPRLHRITETMRQSMDKLRETGELKQHLEDYLPVATEEEMERLGLNRW